jgi:hypothetical protein
VRHRVSTILLLVATFQTIHAAPQRETGIYLLPLECSELLPDNSPFVHFLEAVARGCLSKEKSFAKRIFKVLATREKMTASAQQSREQNPIDVLIRKTLCFYRENKEPLKMVPYDDVAFLAFFRTSLDVLEKQIEETIFQREFDRQQRKEYERVLMQNRELEESVRGQAEVDADRNYERISTSAKRKVKAP